MTVTVTVTVTVTALHVTALHCILIIVQLCCGCRCGMTVSFYWYYNKAHETNFWGQKFFLVIHSFQGFFPPQFVAEPPFFRKYIYIFCLFKIVGNSYATVSHCNERKFLCCGEPRWQRKIPLSRLTTATKESSFVTVNHRAEGKFLCCSEPLQQKIHP